MYTRDGVIVVLPLKEAGRVVRRDVTYLQLVDVTFHGDASSAFVGIVGTVIEHPVGNRTGETLVVAEEVAFKSGIGGRHERLYTVVVDLLFGNLPLRSQIQFTVAGHSGKR